MLTPCNIVVFLQFSVPNDPVCQISSPVFSAFSLLPTSAVSSTPRA